MRKYRFFYHYFKQKGKMSVHFRNQCIIVDNVECNTSCETHWQDRQPRLIMRGKAKSVTVVNGKAIIE